MPHELHRPLATVDRPLGIVARRDLEVVPVEYRRQRAFVVRDPLSLESFHLTAVEHFLLEALQSTTSLAAIQKEFEALFAPRRVTSEVLQQGINQLYGQGLLVSTAAGQGTELWQRRRRELRTGRWQSLLGLLSLRVASFDATQWIDALYARIRWLFGWPGKFGALAIGWYALWILLAHGKEFASRFPSLDQLAQPRYWLLWGATIAGVKLLHELAHALACVHFGRRCHEMGVLMLACVPTLYCDVSDAWRLPSKWQRIGVSAAGILVELVLAAAALALWWHTPPGLLNTLCVAVVLVCSVGTLAVNANPLLRYDGYYILSDLVEVPNLAGRAQGLLPAALQKWLTGETRDDDPLLNQSERRGLWIYAIASRVYLLFVLLAIFAALVVLARPYRAENLVYTLAAISLAGIFGRPLWMLGRWAANPSFRARVRRGRALFAGAGFAIGFALVCCWPIEHQVRGTAVLLPNNSRPVYAATAGELMFCLAAGDRVAQGDVVARLTSDELELERLQLEGEAEVARVQCRQLRTIRTWSDEALRELPAAEAALANAEAQLAEFSERIATLTLTAPTAGVVIAVPDRQGRHNAFRLAGWDGSLLEAQNRGAWVEPGDVLCTIGDPDRCEALVAVEERDVAQLAAGQPVRLLLDALPTRVLVGEIVDVARRGNERPAEQSTIAPGKYHLVKVKLTEVKLPSLVGARGTAKIAARQSTLAKLAIDKIAQLVRLPW